MDLQSEKLVKLPEQPAVKLEESVRIAQTRECLAYMLRLKHEEEKKELDQEEEEETKEKPKIKKGASIEDDGPLLVTG